MILEDMATPALALAIEANFTEEMICLGRSHRQWELHKTPELLWLYSGAGELNGVFFSCLAKNSVGYVDEKINDILDFYQTRHTSFDWTTGPSTYPSYLAERLEAYGFVQVDNTIGMAVDLKTLNEQISVNRDLIITEVENLDLLKTLCEVEKQGFDSSEERALRYYNTYAKAGFGNGTHWRHYIGWLKHIPVASASLLYYAGVAGIYGVSTIPEARRRGIAATMTLHTLRVARNSGYCVAILSPTDMSEAIYRRIGFKDYCTLLHYEWSFGE